MNIYLIAYHSFVTIHQQVTELRKYLRATLYVELGWAMCILGQQETSLIRIALLQYLILEIEGKRDIFTADSDV